MRRVAATTFAAEVVAVGDARASLGRRVRVLRLERDYTQERLAERAGISYKFVGEVERGTANASVDTLEKIASALDVDVVDLFTAGATYPRPPADASYVREVVKSLEGAIATLQGHSRKRRARRKRQ